jgi:nucleoside-diphosphate-sugar epimerase
MQKHQLSNNEHIVIFGCGYVGTALARQLLLDGHRVTALTRNNEKAQALRALGLNQVVCERLDSTHWHEMITEPVDAWINCVSSAGNGLEGYHASYLGGMRSILEWSDRYQAHIKRAVYTSSTSVYPQNTGKWVDETADCTEAPATGRILLKAEQSLLNHSATYPRFIIRLAGIYGPDRSYLIRQLKESNGSIPGRGDYTLNCIHRDDCVSAILSLLYHAPAEASGIFNAADDQPMHKTVVMEWLARQLDVPVPRFDPELQSERLQRRGGKMPDRRIANQKLKRVCGWQPHYSSCFEGYSELLQDSL